MKVIEFLFTFLSLVAIVMLSGVVHLVVPDPWAASSTERNMDYQNNCVPIFPGVSISVK